MNVLSWVVLLMCAAHVNSMAFKTTLPRLRGWSIISSTARLKSLSQVESQLLSYLSCVEHQHIRDISWFLRKIEVSHDGQYLPLEQNPVSVYLLARRFAFVWPSIIHTLKSSNDLQGNSDIAKILELYESQMGFNGTLGMIGKAEIIHVTQRLLEIHVKARLSPDAWVNGSIFNHTSPKLEELHLIECACAALATNYSLFRFPAASFWISLLSGLRNVGSLDEILADYRQEELGPIIKEQLTELNRFLPNVRNNKTVFDESASNARNDPINELCSEADRREAIVSYDIAFKPTQLLCCYLSPYNLPFLNKKVEVISKKPLILIFHNFMNPGTCDNLKSVAAPDLRLNVFVSSTHGNEVVEDQMSQTVLLKDPGRIQRINEELSPALSFVSEQYNLNLENYKDEAYLITNYGLGGSHSVYVDTSSSNANKTKSGAKHFLSVSLSLSDVMVGGALAFPRLGITVKLRKGTMVVWKSDPHEENNEQLQYTACPVVIGSKWTLQKWFKHS